jgi:hypothetical protein
LNYTRSTKLLYPQQPSAYSIKVSRINTLQLLKRLIKIGIFGGGRRIRTFEGRSQRVYSPPHLTALVSLQ